MCCLCTAPLPFSFLSCYDTPGARWTRLSDHVLIHLKTVDYNKSLFFKKNQPVSGFLSWQQKTDKETTYSFNFSLTGFCILHRDILILCATSKSLEAGAQLLNFDMQKGKFKKLE